MELKTSKIDFSNVGGIDDKLKKIYFMMALRVKLLPQMELEEYSSKGFILEGETGTGKSHLAHAICGEFKLKYVNICYGDSHEVIKQIFKCIRNSECGAILIDNIELLCPKVPLNGIEKITTVQMKISLSEILLDSNLIVIATTRKIEEVHSSIREICKFSELILERPDEVSRRKIFEVLLKETKVRLDVDINYLAKNTEKFLPSDIRKLIVRCHQEAMSRSYQLENLSLAEVRTWSTKKFTSEEIKNLYIKMQDFEVAIMKMKSSYQHLRD